MAYENIIEEKKMKQSLRRALTELDKVRDYLKSQLGDYNYYPITYRNFTDIREKIASIRNRSEEIEKMLYRADKTRKWDIL